MTKRQTQKTGFNGLVRLLIVGVILLAAWFWFSSRQAKPATDGAELPAIRPSDMIIRHFAYTLCYSEEHEQPLWVAYELTPEELIKKARRTNDFRSDPAVPTGSATPEDYRGSGYDRGHLAPAADMAFSQQAMSESFLMCNMSPQDQAFNRGIWNELENQVRDWVRQFGPLQIVTAGVLEPDLPKIGANGVSVPRQFYKVLLDPNQPKAIAFLIPNKGTNAPLANFATTIDEVERITGIDFFPALEDNIENQLEAELNSKAWGL